MLHISRRRAEGAAAGPARRPDQALEVQPRRHRRARALAATTATAYEIALERTNTEVAPVVRRPERQEVVPQPGHRPAAARDAARHEPAVAARPTSTSRRSGGGWPTRSPRRRDPDRRGHPLRHAAARGRQPARDRRGRRPRHLRLQVPRRRAGRPGAGGRGDRRAGWPSGSGCARRGWWRSTSTRRSPATRPTRRSRTCSTPARGSTSASTSCPARSASTATCPRRRPTRPARVLWLDAFIANVDRSWRNPNLLLWHGDLWVIDHGAALYFHHGWAGGVDRPGAVRRAAWDADDHVLRRARAELPGGRRRDARPRSAPTCSPRCWPRCPDDWLEPVPGAERPGRRARGVRRLPDRPARHAPVAAGGGAA